MTGAGRLSSGPETRHGERRPTPPLLHRLPRAATVSGIVANSFLESEVGELKKAVSHV
jgi:hypothetical protein